MKSDAHPLAVDDEERDLAIARIPPRFTQIAPETWSVGLNTRSGVVPTSFAYLILDGDGDLHVVDAGTDSDRNWGALCSAITSAAGGLSRVRSVVATHLHPDHLGLSDRLRQATGAPVLLHRVEQEAFEGGTENQGEAILDRWGVPADRRIELRDLPRIAGRQGTFMADRLLENDQLLAIPGRRVRVILTPGHTRGHIMLRDEDLGLLFTGDHLLPIVNPGVGLGGAGSTNPLSDYLESLVQASVFNDDVACPGHGYRFRGVRERAGSIARHHVDRNTEIVALCRQHPDDSIWKLTRRVRWRAGWDALRTHTLASALAQVEMHLEFAGTA